MMKLIVGISGASGSIYGIRLLEVLKDIKDVETHLVISHAAEKVIGGETTKSIEEVKSLATYCHDIQDMEAPIASGSFKTAGMAIIPCSMKTLAGLALSFSSNLLLRAADVTIKEKRPLVIVPREMPFHSTHLEHMLKLSQMGVTIMVPAPPFYHQPKTIDDLINPTVDKTLAVFGLDCGLYQHWQGTKRNK
ncbi:MAG: UbiX family flavin prenyltransferase [Chloroflexota bacterium]